MNRTRSNAGAPLNDPVRFARFAVVGAAGAVIDFSLLNLLHGAFQWPLLPANVVSVGAAIVSNHAGNRRWSFPESRGARAGPQFLRFALVSLAGLVLNTGVLLLVARVLPASLAGAWRTNVAKAAAVGATLLWNFGANRLWTFRALS